MDKILAVYDSDILFASRFTLYFKRKKEYDFEICAFTKKESLLDFLAEHEIEILLLGEGFAPEELPQENIRWICLLSEHLPIEKHPLHLEIFKYQPAQAIMTAAINGYTRELNNSQSNKRSEKLEIISVFSPIPNAAKVSFAWSISMLLSEQSKVLFVPLQLFPVPVLSFIENNHQALSEFIYYLKENSKLIEKMNELINCCGKVSYLSGISHGYDLLSLSKEDVKRWLDEIIQGSDYQIIIFYVEYYSEAVMELLRHSECILMLIGDSRYENAIRKEWEQQITKAGIPMDKNKLSIINVTEEDLPAKGLKNLSELHNSMAWAAAWQALHN